METAPQPSWDAELPIRALNPLAAVWQNTWVAREPAERFSHLGYLHEVVVKCLTAQLYGRVRASNRLTDATTAYLRNQFRQPSTGHWDTLLAYCLKELTNSEDRWSRFLDGGMRKKFRDEALLEFNERVTQLLGHSARNDATVTLRQLLASMLELRNKTRGHGAPRRNFFEEINSLFEASLRAIVQALQSQLWGSLVLLENVNPINDTVALIGQQIDGLLRQPWQTTTVNAPWFKAGCLYVLSQSDDELRLIPVDPLLRWDSRYETTGFYNGYADSKQQIEYLSYGRGEAWHERSRTYESAFSLPLSETRSPEPMRQPKLWSNKGVALYPVDFPLVGQNAVFNGLHKFKQAFLANQANDITGFFALVGDWGLGKTRIGYELFAQSFGHVDSWLLNKDDYVVPGADNGQLMQPQLADGVLPLYIRYDMVCDDGLFAENWVAHVALGALALVATESATADVPTALLQDLRAALHAKGVRMADLAAALAPRDIEDDKRLEAAMSVLRAGGIRQLWVVIDEVETLADRKRGLRDEETDGIKEDYLDMVSIVIKHENYRLTHPTVNFLVLCSRGMRDKIDIGPNRRRTDLIELEPNRIGDVATYVDSLRERAGELGQTVDYPPGTLEGAFIACNRNFGWFNVMMSSIHESFRQAKLQGQPRKAWQLLEEFARSETRARSIFDLTVLDLLPKQSQTEGDLVRQLAFGQLPIDQQQIPAQQLSAARQVMLPGVGSAFSDLLVTHLDAATLAAELVKPEVGFKAHPRGGDWYIYYNSDISISGLLTALRSFSVGLGGDDFLVCRDLDAFTAQLSALYDRPAVDVPQIAEPLHAIFTKYQVPDRRYLGPSFALLQRMDLLLKRDAGSVAFLQDVQKERELEKYAQAVEASDQKRRKAICQGFARLLDEGIATDVAAAPQVTSAASVTFTSEFQSPRMEALQVTPERRVTVVYAHADLEKVARDLEALLSQTGVQPILLLLPPGYAGEEWTRLSLAPRVRLCTIARGLTRVEENLLIKLAGRGSIYAQTALLSPRTLSIRGSMQQTLQEQTKAWRDGIEQDGYLIRPIWHSKSIAEEDFARGYRAMLVNGWNIDQMAPDVSQMFDTTAFDRIRKAAQYNADPGPGQERQMQVVTEEPYAAVVPPAFGALLYELGSPATLETLQRRFFFAVSEKRMKAARQLEQSLNLLRGLGLISMTKTHYRAVDAQTLKDYRQATATWLSGECKMLIETLGDTFTDETVGQLRKRAATFAPKDLEKVEAAAAQANFMALKAGGALQESFTQLVRQVDAVERGLQTIAPASVYQQTGEAPAFQIDALATYVGQLQTDSLWRQVHFYAWLRGELQRRTAEIAHAVQEQMAQAQGLKTVDGRPFPIAPLTQPLRAIQEELRAAPGSGGLSSRNALPVPGYQASIATYLYMKEYANAWRRLEALSKFVERAQPTSFWYRFDAARKRWAQRIEDYKQIQDAWQRLAIFVGDAASPAWLNAKTIRADLDQLAMLVDGGLEQAVNAEVNQGAEKLIDALEAEVTAADKYRTLAQAIAELRAAVDGELNGIIDTTRLQALNRVLSTRRKSVLYAPAPGATYTATKAAFEAFNVQVVAAGRQMFEDGGKETTFDRWVDIYGRMSDNQFRPAPDDKDVLTELAQMKLIEVTYRLA